MGAQLRRLLASGAAYQASSLLASFIALFTLPLYTANLTEAELGYAETLLTFIILASIVLRAGVGEALVRFWFDDDDHARRIALARTATGWAFTATTLAAVAATVAAEPLAELLLDTPDAPLMRAGVLGLWAFTNLEIAYALLRVEERRAAYLVASSTNVVLTVALTVTLVVVLDEGATGYVLGNYAASTAVLVALWLGLRDRVAFLPPSAPSALLRFGLPTVPAEATVFALNVVDRAYLLRTESPRAAGLYAVAAKLSAVVIVAVRGFQAAWPPLAYSITDDGDAGRLYARVTTAYVVVTGLVVTGVALLGRWLVDLLAADNFAEAHEALPWVALGWALYGLSLVFITVAGRAKVTTRNFPAALAGLVANVVTLVLLVEPLGIAGAGIALCAAYVVVLAVIHVLTRRLFRVPFETAKLARAVVVLAAVAVAGELLLPASGLDGFALRAAALALAPVALLGVGVVTLGELRALRGLIGPEFQVSNGRE